MPFIFGGDGATFAVPHALRERAIPALREVQRLSREGFDLSLRVGLVRVSDLLDKGLGMRLAKVRLSPNVTQPTFSGGGWEEAERMVKDPLAPGVLRVQEEEGLREGSFEGFECRWQGVPSFGDHKPALLVAAVSSDDDVNLASYRKLSDKIAQIYGDISSYNLQLPSIARRAHAADVQPASTWPEWRVRSSPLSIWGRVEYFARMVLLNLAGVYLFARGMDTKTVRWTVVGPEPLELPVARVVHELVDLGELHPVWLGMQGRRRDKHRTRKGGEEGRSAWRGILVAA